MILIKMYLQCQERALRHHHFPLRRKYFVAKFLSAFNANEWLSGEYECQLMLSNLQLNTVRIKSWQDSFYGRF